MGYASAWQVREVGEVGGGAKAVADDGVAPMNDGDALEVGTEQVDGLTGRRQRMDADAGAGRVLVFGAEGVGKHAAEGLGRGDIGVERDAGRVAEGERAQVVHAQGVVGMGVRVEDGVDAIDMLAQGLSVKVGAGINKNGVLVVADGDGWTGAAVARVCPRRIGGSQRGAADGALTAKRGDAHAGAAAEKGKVCLHSCCLDAFGE